MLTSCSGTASNAIVLSFTHSSLRISGEKSESSVLYRVGSSADLLQALNADQQTKLFKCLVAERHPEEFYQSFLKRSAIPSDQQKDLMRAVRYYFSLLSGGSSEEEAVPPEEP